ncbi:PKD domain-containing protein [Candidatus Woesearchaeota archaeon]|nr:PKD domain-containing protein [Candidatus Woesearchaeota archaeon]
MTVTIESDIGLTVSITGNSTRGYQDHIVEFQSSVTGGNAPLSYSWAFDDGQTDSQANPIHVYTSPGNYTATLTVTDADGDTGSDSLDIEVLAKKIQITDFNCNDYVVDGHEQFCNATVSFNGTPVGGALVSVYDLNNGTNYGSCTTDSITGSCNAIFIVGPAGLYTVYATSEKDGFVNDTDNQPQESYEVLTERYHIQGLKVYNESAFTDEDYEYYRNETFWVKFQVLDTFNNNQTVSGIVTEATLVSITGGGQASLNDLGEDNNWYKYTLTIPPVHSFIGSGNVFAFAFNFTDHSGGQEIVNLTILNNPPVISQPLPDIYLNISETKTLNLSQYELDVEDSGNDLAWSVYDVDPAIATTSVNSKTLTVTANAAGLDVITMRLTDLDGDYDEQVVNIVSTDNTIVISDFNCGDPVVQDSLQYCNATAKAAGNPIGGVLIDVYDLSNDTFYGSCVTDFISGSCNLLYTVGQPGSYTVYATGTKEGFNNDTDKNPQFSYRVFTKRYLIEDLKVYNESTFTLEDYVYYRAEPIYVKFKVLDQFNGNQTANGVITKATLISIQGGGQTELDNINQSDDFNYYTLVIPPTHNYIGSSNVFAFAFNFSDESGGQEYVNLTILNNLPYISPDIPDLYFSSSDSYTYDLTQNENDIEDSGDNLNWTLDYNSSNGVIQASVVGKSLILTPVGNGEVVLNLSLFDLDMDFDTQDMKIYVNASIFIPQAPIITSSPPREFTPSDDKCLENYVYDVEAYDPNNDPLTYSLGLHPSGMVIDPVTGLVTWSPCNGDVGNHEIQILVSDGMFTTIQQYTLTVNHPKQPTDPREVLFIHTIRMNNEGRPYAHPGDELYVTTGFENIGYRDLKQAQIRVTCYELGISRKIGPFTGPEVDEIQSRGVLLEIPEDAPKGVHACRLELYTDGGLQRIRHREVRII